MPYAGAPSPQSRTSNPRRKRRRRRRRKKNPSTATWVLLAGFGAAAVGGGIAYAVYRKRKKAQLPPGVTPAGPTPVPAGPTPSPPAPGAGKQAAPAFPYSLSEAKAIEHSWAQTVFAESIGADGQLTRNIEDITDEAFYQIYKIRKIPAKANRGPGWQPYIDSWLRIRDIVRPLVESYVPGVS